MSLRFKKCSFVPQKYVKLCILGINLVIAFHKRVKYVKKRLKIAYLD